MGIRLPVLVAAIPLLAAASVPIRVDRETVDRGVERARLEVRAAEADMHRWDRAVAKARGEAARLTAERQAAAAAIVAAEARVSGAEAETRLAEARATRLAERLAQQQAPLAALLAGIVSMGRRPPFLGSVDSRSLDEFIRVRALLDTSLPVIRERSATLSAELAESRRLQAVAASARDQIAEERRLLRDQQSRLAMLEAKAAERAARLGVGAVSASDIVIASAESLSLTRSEAERRRAELKLAAELGVLPPAPPRPGVAGPPKPPLAYRMPVVSRVLEGLGSVSDTGIRSRGILLDAHGGQEVRAPADGKIAFTGPFRRHDGVVIIDHGRGWMTLMTGVRTGLARGTRVRLGEPLGHALGPVAVELSMNGRPASAALIAGSSQSLFIKGNSG